MQATTRLIERYAAPVPRYTSYPTANHFSPAIRGLHYVDWLSGLERDTSLSLYVHVPFCDTLCWYCACSTKAVRRYEPVKRYVDVLLKEIANVASLLPQKPPVTHLHWGGGSPSILQPDDIARIADALRSDYPVTPAAEFAVEIDPRRLSAQQVAAFAGAGVNRVSLGVQDFDERVQAAIGREQSYDLTRTTIEQFRERGVGSINIDLVYGLPHQTTESLARTLSQVLDLAPDRIAAFGYAHLPQRAHNQRLIDGASLPGPLARFEQSGLIARMLEDAGYRRIGLDHYARATDALAERPLRRNFQGYTSDAAGALLGFGASAIGQLPDGFVQNSPAIHEYERMIAKDGLATIRGIALSPDDRVRAFAIERLMCDFRLSSRGLIERFGEAARPVLAIAATIAGRDDDGLIAVTDDGIEVTDLGRPFVRSICAGFDLYLTGRTGAHSVAV